MSSFMKRFLLLFFIFILTSDFAFAQDLGSSYDTTAIEKPVFKPTISLGSGMLSFWGDVYNGKIQNPATSRLGYQLAFNQPLNNYLQLNLYAIFGKLGANERLITRNVNFESQLRIGGVGVTYNFDHFLPKKRIISPYLSIGIESFEYLSKTDLKDASGNKYYYWADGSIRNMDETSPSAAFATMLQRDYSYESDIRELDQDGFGKYAERSWAIPLGVGAIFHLNKSFDFKVGTSLHYSFTDYIDGLTEKSVGNRKGDAKNDKFIYSSFSLSYNLEWPSGSPLDTLPPGYFDDVNYLALDAIDYDEDGVIDTKDSCLGTPKGAAVNDMGCPLDDDMDGVPNYADKELKTPAGSLVNADGIQLTDSMLALNYRIYTDSVGLFAKTVYVNHASGVPGSTGIPPIMYTVLLGNFKNGITPQTMTKFLSIPDISTTILSDSSTSYSVGKYRKFSDAVARKSQFINDSLDLKLGYFQDGKFFELTQPPAQEQKDQNTQIASNDEKSGKNSSTSKGNKNSKGESVPDAPVTDAVVFRVQLGAYKTPLSKNVFPDVADLVQIKTEDGLYKYMAGSYSNFTQAANRRMDLVSKGYKGSFITAYKNGKRVALQDNGATPANKNEKIKENLTEPGKPVSGIDKKLVVFKIQVGIYRDQPPADIQAKYNKITGVKRELTTLGLNRYIVGEFNDYKSAEKMKNEMIKKGLSDSFVISFFNGQYITVQEALELLK